MADPFTAADWTLGEVRAMRARVLATIPGGYDQRALVALCDAYATRLEQDERLAGLKPTGPVEIIVGTWGTPESDALLDQAREEGRREILREILKMGGQSPWYCQFCGEMKPDNNHESDCLWLKAQSLSQEPARTT